MIDGTAVNIVSQITLYKLEFSRQMLREANLPSGGNRATVRERLLQALSEERLSMGILQELLNELDLWGQQRVRWAQLPPQTLAAYQTAEAVADIATQAGMADLLEGEVTLVPPVDFTPMVIAYEERGTGRFLRLIGAKTQAVREEQRQLEPIRIPKRPDVVYYPFVEKAQKVIAFADIDLGTGLSLVSATLVRQGIQFTADFGGLYQTFEPFFSFAEADFIDLFRANRAIHALPTGEVQLAEGRRRTSTGGTVSCRAHNRRADIRADNELSLTHQALPDAPGVYCDCYWGVGSSLAERVHTHIYGPDGEISILGKVKEESARHVLRRVLELNYA